MPADRLTPTVARASADIVSAFWGRRHVFLSQGLVKSNPRYNSKSECIFYYRQSNSACYELGHHIGLSNNDNRIYLVFIHTHVVRVMHVQSVV